MNTKQIQTSRSASLRDWFRLPYFRGEMRRAWPKTLCYTLFFFFFLPLPLMLEANARWERGDENIAESLALRLGESMWLYTLAAVAVALFAGMLAMRYLTRRACVDYYHSLPLRREALLLMQWSSGLLSFLMALAVNLLLSAAVIVCSVEPMAPIGAPLSALLLCVGYMVLTFVLFYTLTVFCGMLCGTSIMQVLVTGLLVGAFPLFRLLYLTYLERVASTVDIGYIINNGSWKWTSPFIRLIYLANGRRIYTVTPNVHALDHPFLWWEVLLWLVFAALFFWGSVLIYRRRHVERAGTPVVFRGVAVAVKWTVVLLGTMSAGWIMWELGDLTLFWLFFGFLLGGLLSFLLINAILTKDAKQMFVGWRRLILFLILFSIVAAGAGYAFAAVEKILPRRIERISLTINGDDYMVDHYTDEAVIEAWRALWETDPNETSYVEMEEEYYKTHDGRIDSSAPQEYYFREQRIPIKVRVDVGGLVIPYKNRNYITAKAEALLRAVTDSAEFEAGWDALMAQAAEGYYMAVSDDGEWKEELNGWDGPIGDVQLWSLLGTLYSKTPTAAPITSETVRTLIAEVPEDIGFDFFQSPTYAQVNSAGINTPYYWFSFSVTANMPALYRDALGLADEDQFYAALADSILTTYGGVYVAKHESYAVTLTDDTVIHVSDRGQLIELLRGMGTLEDTYGGSRYNSLTVLDSRYGIIIPGISGNRVRYMIRGRVPAFVESALG